MIPKRYYPSVLAGFGASVLSIIPEIKSVSCCLIVPAAAFISLYLFNRIMNGESPIKLNRALSFGLITGLVAAIFTTFFDLLITYLTHSNDLVTGLPYTRDFITQYNLGPLMEASIKLMEDMVKEIQQNGFSVLYTVMISLSNMIIFSVFGMLGGLFGMAILNKKNRRLL
ncbi:hypothetical protein ACFLSS_00960 [Bacteroidota bacterium]